MSKIEDKKTSYVVKSINIQVKVSVLKINPIVEELLSFKKGIPFRYLLNLKRIKIIKNVAVDINIIPKVKNSLGTFIKSNTIDKIKVAIKKAKELYT